jgi:hypothetical protein
MLDKQVIREIGGAVNLFEECNQISEVAEQVKTKLQKVIESV